MTIGERIKQRRTELDLSVDEIASRLGKNRATVYRYENSDIENLPTTVLEPLSKILETTPAYLMGWEQNLNGFEDGSSKSDFVVDLLSDIPLTEHVKKLQLLNEEHKQTIFDNIDYWYDKEGH